jgi:hypothetical protein
MSAQDVPILVCHDQIVVECDAEQVASVKTWLERTMIEGMEAVLNGTEKYRQNVYKDTGERLSASQANKDREAFRAAFPEFHRWQQTYGAKRE